MSEDYVEFMIVFGAIIFWELGEKLIEALKVKWSKGENDELERK